MDPFRFRGRCYRDSNDQHDFSFHIDSIRELARVAAEIRVFPLVELGSTPSGHLQPVIDRLESLDLRAEVVRVPYEFQKGGNQMLVINRLRS